MSKIAEQVQWIIDNPGAGYDMKRDIPMMPIDDIAKEMELLGFEMEELSGDEHNGWEVDFCYYFKHPVHCRIYLTGSLYYGDYQICWCEDDE